MTQRCVSVLALAVLVAACDAETGDTGIDAEDAGADSDAPDGADGSGAGGETCDFAEPRCDGQLRVACDAGTLAIEDCAQVGYCTYGACVASGIVLPDDAAPHQDSIEWWYYTGHVVDGDQEFGFEIALFQQRIVDLLGPNAAGGQEFGWMCHVALLDKNAGSHVFTQGLSFVTREWTSDPITLDVDNCRLELSGDGHDRIVGTIPAGREGRGAPGTWRFDLEVAATKPVAHHGTDGVIAMADGGDSFYYSYTHLDAAGTIESPDGTFEVTGQAWMDHQWGAFATMEFKGWDWWSMQFDDGWEIMLFVFRSWDDEVVMRAGTLVDPDGNTRAIDGLDAFSIDSLRAWPSAQTDGTYPLDWDIRITELDWDLAVRTQVDEQEVPNPAKTYWEGAVTVDGTRGTTPVQGVGYVELTGYASNPLDP